VSNYFVIRLLAAGDAMLLHRGFEAPLQNWQAIPIATALKEINKSAAREGAKPTGSASTTSEASRERQKQDS